MTSRRQRLIDPRDPWLGGCRAVLRRTAAAGERIVTSEAVAGFEFVRRMSERLEVPLTTINPPESSADDTKVSAIDRAVFYAAKKVYVLSIRSGGNLERLLREALQHSADRTSHNAIADGPDPTVVPDQLPEIVLVDIPGLQPARLREELCGRGAQLWQPAAEDCKPLEPKTQPEPSAPAGKLETPDAYVIVPFPAEQDWEFLSHTTRACPGPWPAESREAYIDSLLESDPGADHSPLGSLRRILAQRQLIASSRTIRDGYRMVSFTARPLLQLPKLHQFRPHRVHWDFEPYGICIRRDWLMRHGARPVIYGGESCWAQLSATDRPFFQLALGKSGIDWSIEQEWRYPGDLDLNQLTASDVLIFVPNFAAARSISEVSDWPITLWPGNP